MADESRTWHAGLQLPHPLIQGDAVWEAESSYTARGPQPGAPAAQSTDTDLVLEATGAQVDADVLNIECQRGGHPRPAGAQFLWRHNTTGARYGWEPPVTASGSEIVDTDTLADGVYGTHAITTDDGWILLATSSRTVATRNVRLFRRDPATGAWAVTAVDPLASSTQTVWHLYPCLVRIGTGSNSAIHLYYWRIDVAGNLAQIAALRSTDNGATWSTVADSCIPIPLNLAGAPGAGALGGDPGRLRAAYKGGEVLLLAHVSVHNTSLGATKREQVWQWASDDDGSSFEEVSLSVGAEDGGRAFPDVVVSEGVFVVAIVIGGRDGPATFMRLGSAYTPHLDAILIDPPALAVGWVLGGGGGGVYTRGDCTLVADDDGVLYAFGVETVGVAIAAGEGETLYSTDYGRSWNYLGGEPTAATKIYARWFGTVAGFTTFYPVNISATVQRGRVVMLHTSVTPTSSTDQQPVATYLGGYTQHVLPAYGLSHRIADRTSWRVTWFGTEKLSLTGWGTAGVGTETLDGISGEDITTAAASFWCTLNPTSTMAQGIILEAPLARTAGVGRLYIRLADGAKDYRVSVYKDGSGNTVFYDDVAAGALATVALAAATQHTFRVAVVEGKASAWYRVTNNSEAREWTAMAVDQTIIDAGAVSANNEIRVGTDGSAANHDVYIGPVYVAHGTYTGLQLAEGQTNPDDLFGRTYSTRPMYVDGGTLIAATRGPGVAGDEHQISTRYDHPIEHILQDVEASPSKMFATTDTTAFQVAWRMGTAVDDHLWPGEIIGITYLGGNLREFDIEYLVSGGAWTKLGDTITLSEDIDYTRIGEVIEPNPSSSGVAEFYLSFGELIDGYFEDNDNITRKICENTEGNWQDTGVQDRKWPSVRLDGLGAIVDASGSGKLIFPRAQALIYLSAVRAFEGLRISVPVSVAPTAPPEGYWRCKFAIGPVKLWGTPHSRGWARVQEPLTDLVETPDGIRRADTRNTPRRTRSIIWTDIVNSRTAQGLATDALSYIQATTTANARPAAHRRDSAFLTRDLQRYTRGPGKLVTLIPYAPAGPPDTVVHKWQWARGALNGRIISPGRITHVLGDAEQKESIRVAEIVVSEEL